MISGGNHRGDRQKDDFYSTTPECTLAFLAAESDHLKGHRILEPCCGTGAISSILIGHGFDVVSSDLVDRGYGQVGIDFLQTTSTDCTAMVTNPPYKLAEQFIRHALEDLQVTYLALLLKSQYWHSSRRYKMFQQHPPAVIYPLLWRPDFLNRGGPTMDFQWTVWRPHDGETVFRPLPKV